MTEYSYCNEKGGPWIIICEWMKSHKLWPILYFNWPHTWLFSAIYHRSAKSLEAWQKLKSFTISLSIKEPPIFVIITCVLPFSLFIYFIFCWHKTNFFFFFIFIFLSFGLCKARCVCDGNHIYSLIFYNIFFFRRRMCCALWNLCK